MLNKDFAQFMPSLSSVRQKQANERLKAGLVKLKCLLLLLLLLFCVVGKGSNGHCS